MKSRFSQTPWAECTVTLSLQVLLPFPLSALMMGLIGMGNNPEAHATVACAVAVYNAMK